MKTLLYLRCPRLGHLDISARIVLGRGKWRLERKWIVDLAEVRSEEGESFAGREVKECGQAEP
jgi:hypothetical protein